MIQTNLKLCWIFWTGWWCRLGVDYHLVFITTFFSFCWILSLTNFLNSSLRSVFTILLILLTTYRHFTNMLYRGSFLFLFLEYTWIYRAYHLQTLRCLPLEVRLYAGLVQLLFLRLICTKWLSMLQLYFLSPVRVFDLNSWFACSIGGKYIPASTCSTLTCPSLTLRPKPVPLCHRLWTHSSSLSSTNKSMVLSDLLY